MFKTFMQGDLSELYTELYIKTGSHIYAYIYISVVNCLGNSTSHQPVLWESMEQIKTI